MPSTSARFPVVRSETGEDRHIPEVGILPEMPMSASRAFLSVLPLKVATPLQSRGSIAGSW
jgi:hypothetical protein